MSELKPSNCPFCNGSSIHVFAIPGTFASSFCQCRDCRTVGPTLDYLSEDDAIKAWNRRAQPEANADAKDAITDTEMLDFVTREKMTIYLETERRKVPLTDGTFNYRYENVPVGWTLGVTSNTFDTPRDAIRAAIDAARQAKEKGND